jgi:hypothetical protein
MYVVSIWLFYTYITVNEKDSSLKNLLLII